VDFDVLKDPDLKKPYPFESRSGTRGPKKKPRRASPAYLLAELTWRGAGAAARGPTSPSSPWLHRAAAGPHRIRSDTDAFDADTSRARVVRAECSDPKPLCCRPSTTGSRTTTRTSRAPSASLPTPSPASSTRWASAWPSRGISKLVIINGHGGNVPALKFAAQMINRGRQHPSRPSRRGETSDADVAGVVDTPGDAHSGEIETSTTLATRPHLVRMDEAVRFVPDFSSRYLDFSSRRSVEWNTRTAKISPSGVLGDPTRASAEKGRRIWDIMVRNLVELIEHLKRMPLEEIYQRRY